MPAIENTQSRIELKNAIASFHQKPIYEIDKTNPGCYKTKYQRC
jgi:hypothetical protein